MRKKIESSGLDAMARAACWAKQGRRCYVCGADTTDYGEVHHLVSRINMNLRWDLDNLVGLCRDCHAQVHEGKHMLKMTIIQKEPNRLKNIRLKRHAVHKWTYIEKRELYDELRLQMQNLQK